MQLLATATVATRMEMQLTAGCRMHPPLIAPGPAKLPSDLVAGNRCGPVCLSSFNLTYAKRSKLFRREQRLAAAKPI
jgi:hypothetical protein